MGLNESNPPLEMHERPAGNISPPEDARRVIFREGCRLEGRKPGVVYVMDSALANQFVQMGAADIVEASGPAPAEDRAVKTAMNDRAIRGKRGG